MASQFYCSKINAMQDALLPGIMGAAEWSLWIKPKNHYFVEEDFLNLFAVFSSLRGIVWYVSSGNSTSQSIRDYKRAFGNWSSLNTNIVVKTTIEYANENSKLYSDIAWVSSNSANNLVTLFSQSTVGKNSSISFIPYNENSAQKWANIVSGLNWLWLCNEWVATSQQPLLNADAVVLDYIRLTIEIDGIPGLVYSDIDNKKGLLFLGKGSVLKDLQETLLTQSEIINDTTFNQWFQRGVNLVVSP